MQSFERQCTTFDEFCAARVRHISGITLILHLYPIHIFLFAKISQNVLHIRFFADEYQSVVLQVSAIGFDPHHLAR